jgi:hypothetical protein
MSILRTEYKDAALKSTLLRADSKKLATGFASNLQLGFGGESEKPVAELIDAVRAAVVEVDLAQAHLRQRL